MIPFNDLSKQSLFLELVKNSNLLYVTGTFEHLALSIKQLPLNRQSIQSRDLWSELFAREIKDKQKQVTLPQGFIRSLWRWRDKKVPVNEHGNTWDFSSADTCIAIHTIFIPTVATAVRQSKLSSRRRTEMFLRDAN